VGRRAELRAAFGLPAEAPVVLFCGKLIPKKRPLLALEAFATAQAGRSESAALLYVGDGELRADVERQARAHPDLCVRVAGFLNQTQVTHAYAAADVLLLPSGWGETWGLAVNEAMNFGLPAIVSDRVGCAGDLVRHGETGFIVPADDAQQLAEHIRSLLDQPALRQTMGARARERVAQWGIEQCVAGLVEAVERAGRPRQLRSRAGRPAGASAESSAVAHRGQPT
jgi:glycosyltransferase involved in cell wall biosynthesis